MTAGQTAALYCVPAPSPGTFVQWPESFGTRFTVCVDTEEEFDWTKPFSRDARGTTHMNAMPEAHARFAAHGVPLTFLIDHPIATCQRSVEILQRLLEDRRSAVGTQLHPWVSPPFEEEVCAFNSFAGNLPAALEEAKLTILTDAIRENFGQPLIYRAGRYGIGPHTIALLQRLGYRADTSIRSGYDYAPDNGVDFTAVPNDAFYTEEGPVELPLTTMFLGSLSQGGARLHRSLAAVPRGQGIAARARLLSRVALTPEDMPLADALEAVRAAVGQGLRLLSFSFHSPSVEPGHTPYVRSAADLADFYRWWDGVFALLDRLGVTNASLDEILEAACGPAPASANG